MSTNAAQRRLLESLAALHKTPGGIPGLRLGLPYAIELARTLDLPELVTVWEALDSLAASVEADLSPKEVTP